MKFTKKSRYSTREEAVDEANKRHEETGREWRVVHIMINSGYWLLALRPQAGDLAEVFRLGRPVVTGTVASIVGGTFCIRDLDGALHYFRGNPETNVFVGESAADRGEYRYSITFHVPNTDDS